ncbi:MAG TPA: PstS family phosphate ABC transporter substrate-binding protein [Chitinophagales bacterium]|nr:PstS family phosphate ABC transporter substrate-binding protein [Chitinophagales bacterium]HNM29228.1 PstS family phosphate ABC transporter substrate-binding protein [Chitinophagales bacterium]
MLKNLSYLGVIAVIGLSSCGGNKGGEAAEALTGSVMIDGSSTVYPISEAVAEEFRAEQPDVNVALGESGTGGGMKKFGRGEIDICDASRPIKDSEKAACDSAGIKYLELEIAYDGIAVMVNPKNTWVDKMTVAELKMIWESAAQGKIKTWNQVRPEWPNSEIHLYSPGTASGTYEYFTEVICGKKGDSRGDINANEDDNTLVNGIAGDEGALGYFGMAYYENNTDKLKIVPIDNGSGGVIPTTETVLSKTYAPLSRPLYIYVNEASMAKPQVLAFVKYYMDNVEALSKEVGYVPLQSDIYTAMKQKLAAYNKPAAE